MPGLRESGGPAARPGGLLAVHAVAFAGFVAALFLLGTVGVPDAVTGVLSLALVPVLLAASGIACRTMRIDVQHIAGRSTAPLQAGMAAGADWMSLAAPLVLAGALPLAQGYGGAIAIGWMAGYVLSAVLIAPQLHRSGAHGVPAFFALRYGSGLARLAGSALVCGICVLYAVALLSIAGLVVSRFLGFDPGMAVLIGLVAVLACAVPGGLRAVIFAQAAFWIVIAIVVIATSGWATETAGVSPSSLTEPDPDMPARIFLMLCLAAGTASMPHVLARQLATGSASDARRSAAWSALFIAMLVLSAPAFSTFSGPPPLETGDAMSHLVGALAAAAIAAAALSTAAALLLAASGSMADDIHHAMIEKTAPAGRRLFVSRLLLVFLGCGAAFVASAPPADLATMIAWAFCLAASGLFPALVLGIWWKRANGAGALAGIVAGSAACLAVIVASRAGISIFAAGVDGPMAAIVGVPSGFAVMIAVSLATRAPAPAVADLVESLHGRRDDAA